MKKVTALIGAAILIASTQADAQTQWTASHQIEDFEGLCMNAFEVPGAKLLIYHYKFDDGIIGYRFQFYLGRNGRVAYDSINLKRNNLNSTGQYMIDVGGVLLRAREISASGNPYLDGDFLVDVRVASARLNHDFMTRASYVLVSDGADPLIRVNLKIDNRSAGLYRECLQSTLSDLAAQAFSS